MNGCVDRASARSWWSRRNCSHGSSAVPFGAEQAALAARLYGGAKRGRGREIDLAIAACALHDNATLWTLNQADFRDIADLTLL